MKRITLCADDFAQSEAIANGILQLVAAGRVQAVSCMTNSAAWPVMAPRLKGCDTSCQAGLHFNLTHGFGRPSEPVSRLMLRSLLSTLDLTEIRRGFIAQWLAFEEHFGSPPAFVDGHQHVHGFPGIRRVVIEETLKRNPMAWVRVPHAGGLTPKALVLQAMTASLPRQLRQAGLRGNARFAGFRPYHNDFNFARFFRHILTKIKDGTLVMCHPGLAADDPSDPIAGCRQAELDYLMSDQFTADMANAGVRAAAMS